MYLPLALEEFVLVDMDDHIEVTRRAAAAAALALAGESHARAPVSTPAGMRTLTFLLRLTSPGPWQSLQGSVITWPEPAQRLQAVLTWKKPWLRIT